MSDLPLVLMLMGAHDILWGQMFRLQQKLKQSGYEVQLIVGVGKQHVFGMHATRTRGAARALIEEFINES